jgi:hypothetical protein
MNIRTIISLFAMILVGIGSGLASHEAAAGLTDTSQVNANGNQITLPGAVIGKSLDKQIGNGHGDALTSGSSVYLIKRDPARAIRRGRQIFQRKFTESQGFGPRVSATAAGDIMANRALGAGLVDSCSGCHGRPRGSAGFGGEVVTRPDSRDAPHLFGLGLQEMLADEITTDLRAIRTQALQRALSSNRPVTRKLKSKGIHYGKITAYPSGDVDTAAVEGVDKDLRVRPFSAEGGTVTIREFIIGAMKAEMGLEASDPVLCAVTDPLDPQRAESPSGFVYDPGLDNFDRPPICDGMTDRDGDGVVEEIDPALVDYVEFYLLNYFKPAVGKQTARTRGGRDLMTQIGCTKCHKQKLTIEHDRRIADVETRFDKNNGIFNHLFATVTTLFSVVEDGYSYPMLLPKGNSFRVNNIFTDYKRHDLGPFFHEREYDGTLVKEFMTKPLWGVGSTAPYGHDGRSINLHEVILRHGGEAQASRNKYSQLIPDKQRQILEFLQTLLLFPPDDTASDLNAGNPSTQNPQDPLEHGSINLGALFQINSEGQE